MSHDIFEHNGLQVTAFAGKGFAPCVQICLSGGDYVQLDEEKTLELAHALLSRVLRKEGYRATD